MAMKPLEGYKGSDMSSFRRSGGQIVLVLLACLSLAISIYLTIVHYDSTVPVVCSASGLVNCENVLTSSYSVVPGTTLPVAIPGILWSVVALALPLAVLKFGPELRRVRVAEALWGFCGLLTVFYLVYAEIVQIHNICAWCTGVHVIVLLYLLLAVFLLQESAVDEDVVYEDEASAIPVYKEGASSVARNAARSD
jgi:uncharacterized membrane protein